MKYVLLLRGVNVGGKHKVVMPELRSFLEEMGYSEVSSYINSGNLFFDTQEEYDVIIDKISNLLNDKYDFEIPFALISSENYLKDKENLPSWWYSEMARKDVLFFSTKVKKEVLSEFVKNTKLYNEIVYCGEIGVYWGKYDEKEFLKTSYHKKLIKQEFYKFITIRNGNTFEKITELISKK